MGRGLLERDWRGWRAWMGKGRGWMVEGKGLKGGEGDFGDTHYI